MRKAYHVLCLALALVAVGADWQNGNDGVNRPGSDLPGIPVDLDVNSQPKDCAKMCYDSPECKAWVFMKKNCTNTTPRCYLKDSVPLQVRDPCAVSL